MKVFGASVVIVTYNRQEEVLSAIRSCLSQTYQPLEILVYDDQSTDGTSEVIIRNYPSVKLFRQREKSSPTKLRNQGFRNATGKIVFSLDDDSYFTDSSIIQSIVDLFENNPQLAVVGIPFIEPYQTSLHPKLTLKPGDKISSYTGCAAAFRRQFILDVGGYRELFEYYGEEKDLAVRLIDNGYILLQGGQKYVVHTKSRTRDSERQMFLSIRNTIFFHYFNTPFPQVLFRLISYIIGVIQYRFAWSSLPKKLVAISAGFKGMFGRKNKRQPVSRKTYHHVRSLPGHGAEPWDGPAPPPCCD